MYLIYKKDNKMEYLLTQAEFDSLTPINKVRDRDEALEAARQIILRLTKIDCGSEYCSACPISSIGLRDNGGRPPAEVSRLICIKNRRYPK